MLMILVPACVAPSFVHAMADWSICKLKRSLELPVDHMAVAYGIAYSWYRSQPKVLRLADVLQGC